MEKLNHCSPIEVGGDFFGSDHFKKEPEIDQTQKEQLDPSKGEKVEPPLISDTGYKANDNLLSSKKG